MKLRIRGKDKQFAYDIKKNTIVIGRSSDCDFVIPMDDFSRHHCQITVKGEYFFITDLGSKNGVTIDGVLLSPNTPHAIYPRNKVVLARFFELALPNQQFSGDAQEEQLTLATPVKRK